MSNNKRTYTLWGAVRTIAYRAALTFVLPLFFGIVLVISPIIGVALMWDDMMDLVRLMWNPEAPHD
jgi:hypothetical protein